VTPSSGWAVDPFGHSPSMTYLLKGAGLSNMVIQRVHYAVKKHFAQQQTLEFQWRQSWGERKPSNTFLIITTSWFMTQTELNPEPPEVNVRPTERGNGQK